MSGNGRGKRKKTQGGHTGHKESDGSGSAKLRYLFNMQSGVCPYCGVDMTLEHGHPNTATIEHIIPKSKGGKQIRGNYMAACLNCNNERGDLPIALYLIRKKFGEPQEPAIAYST